MHHLFQYQEVNFKNAVIFMTSNIGSEAIIDACLDNPEPPSSLKLIETIRPHLQAHFKAALLGRMSIVPYLPLNENEYARIVKMKLEKIQNGFILERRLMTLWIQLECYK